MGRRLCDAAHNRNMSSGARLKSRGVGVLEVIGWDRPGSRPQEGLATGFYKKEDVVRSGRKNGLLAVPQFFVLNVVGSRVSPGISFSIVTPFDSTMFLSHSSDLTTPVHGSGRRRLWT